MRYSVAHIYKLAVILTNDITVKELINEEVLCVLRKNKLTSQIEVDYVKIEKTLSNAIDSFTKLCENENSTLEQIMHFIKTTADLNLLTTHYRYCVYLNGSYQAFGSNNQETITEIINRQQLMLLNQKNDPERFDINKATLDFKQELIAKYVLWNKAFAINKAYRICHEDKSVLTFSHRIDGWSNPLYQLTPNFSVEIKTNFGYGRVSYFYTKLKYKNIEITPFSEWIDYEFAKFSEIVRYTQSHLLRNEYWLEAMEFSKHACNLSMTNEVKFVEKYVIDECERMVSGLENIFHKDHFTFKNRERNQYSTDKKGHVLVEFRGEKISGALDFISKILEFEKIASIKSFIDRIESCNKRIQPILVEESKIIKVKIVNLNEEINTLKPKYDKVIVENNLYNQRRIELQNEMLNSGQLKAGQFDAVKLNEAFNSNFPEFKEFQDEYKRVTETFRILTEQLQNLVKVYNNIIAYNERINNHFRR